MTYDIIHLIESAHAAPEQRNRLAEALNHLVLHDFEALLRLLYRVDVPEQKVRQLLLQQPGSDAGVLLAELLLQRQQQKAAARAAFTKPQTDIPEDDRW